MSKVFLRVRKMQQAFNGWVSRVGPRADYLIDKYEIIKVGCIVGTAINLYLIYDGTLSILVLKGIKNEVDRKKELFYKRVENKKAQVFALLQELEQENLLPAIGQNKQLL